MSDDDSELTPIDNPTVGRRVLAKLEEMTLQFSEMSSHCAQAANNSMAAVRAVEGLRDEMTQLEKRVSDLELSDKWLPRVLWLVTFALSIIALLRTTR